MLLVTPDFPPALGGIQRVLAEVAAELASTRAVTVVAPADDGAEADTAAPYEVVRTRGGWGGARSAAVLGEMAWLTGRSPADLIVAGHVMTLPAVVAGARGRAVTTMLYGSELWDPRARRVLRTFAGRSERFVAISEFTAAEARKVGVPPSSIEVVALGADLPREPVDAHERLALLGLVDGEGVRPFLLTLARLTEPHKGQDAVLRATAALVGYEPRFRYVVAGDGPLRSHLEAVSASSGAGVGAVFAGRVDEETKGALLSGCRALAMVSREAQAAGQFEGFGLVYLEAALAGRPSLAGRAGAAPEVVTDEETGLLVEPDRPAQIADAALRLLDERFADRLGAEAQRRAVESSTWASARPRLVEALLHAAE